MLCPHWKAATYWARYHSLTPRHGRRKSLSPVHRPSGVLQCTSRTPSPSRSRAQADFGPEGSTVRWIRPCRPPTRPYPRHSSVSTVAPSRQVPSMTSSSSAPPADARTSRRTSPESRPTAPATGGRSLAKLPWPRRRSARRRGGSAGSGCRTPFFPRVDVALVGLDHGVAQRVAVQAQGGVVLEPVPQLEQVLAVAAQLAGHPGRRLGLGDAAEDQQQLRRRPADAPQGRAGEGVEDAAAAAALEVDHRVAMAAVDAEAVGGPAPRAGQAVGVQQLDEPLVAGVLVHQVDQGEVHRRASRSPGATSSTGPPPKLTVKGPSTGSAS